MSDALEYQFQDTDRRVRDLDRRLDDLESEHESLKSRFGYTEDLDHDLRTIRDNVSSCESAAEEVDGRVDDLEGRVEAAERTVKRLTQHVRLLEGQIIATGKIPHADLDTFTTDQHALARTMRTGQEAADDLLHDDLRYQYQAQIRRFNETRSAHEDAREEVVALTGALLSHRHGTPARTQTATKLRTAIANEATRRRNFRQQSGQARRATAALAADRTAAADKQPAIAAGERAEQRLTLALCSKLADALSNRRILPSWFATVLGPAPPARATDSWLECATSVLLYRLTYRVDDQVLALGPRPDPADEHRFQWWERLRKDLGRW
ncbi:hypothetical protein OG521_00220 [Streptomyces sp. NBC_01463]